jgi:hypothetical protein
MKLYGTSYNEESRCVHAEIYGRFYALYKEVNLCAKFLYIFFYCINSIPIVPCIIEDS